MAWESVWHATPATSAEPQHAASIPVSFSTQIEPLQGPQVHDPPVEVPPVELEPEELDPVPTPLVVLLAVLAPAVPVPVVDPLVEPEVELPVAAAVLPVPLLTAESLPTSSTARLQPAARRAKTAPVHFTLRLWLMALSIRDLG